MTYVAVRKLLERLDAYPPLALGHRAAVRAGSPIEEVSIDLDELIDYRICKSQELYRSGHVRLVQCGFRITVAAPASLEWVRIRLEPSSAAFNVISTFPGLVVRDSTFTGRIFLDDQTNELHWQEREDPNYSGGDARYAPRVVAGLTSRGGTFWDFHANDSQPLSGTDQLFLSGSASNENAEPLRFDVDLMLAVSLSDKQEVYLRSPSQLDSVVC